MTTNQSHPGQEARGETGAVFLLQLDLLPVDWAEVRGFRDGVNRPLNF